MKEKSENRKALPRFFLTLLGSLIVGGILGFFVGVSRGLGLDTAAVAEGLNAALKAATPWGIPVSTLLMLGPAFMLYQSARKKYEAWDGGDEDEGTESADLRLSWVLLLSAVQLLLDFFFMAAVCVYCVDESAMGVIGMFVVSCGLVIFAQQKAIDLTKRMNPEKRGSVYDAKFQKKWYASLDESERQQTGQASFHAFQITSRVCLGLWLVLVVLSMVFEMSILPVFTLLLVWGVLQVSYTLECIRLSKHSQSR